MKSKSDHYPERGSVKQLVINKPTKCTTQSTKLFSLSTDTQSKDRDLLSSTIFAPPIFVYYQCINRWKCTRPKGKGGLHCWPFLVSTLLYPTVTSARSCNNVGHLFWFTILAQHETNDVILYIQLWCRLCQQTGKIQMFGEYHRWKHI
jgi:hypothetical protein